ncbi:MAG: septum formation initiator family protein [Bacteroidales bacterium]|nr:septum formation initiator family protein [Bacteroidales bacterium]
MGKFREIWNRKKDGPWKEERSFLRFVIIATVLCVLFLFIKKDNVIRWVQAGFTIRAQQERIDSLQRENSRLEEQIKLLSTNRDSLEKFAREHFYFAAEGDDVYLMEE